MASEMEFQALINFVRHEWVPIDQYADFFHCLSQRFDDHSHGGDHRWRYYEVSLVTRIPDPKFDPDGTVRIKVIRLVHRDAVYRRMQGTPYAEEWDAAEVIIAASGRRAFSIPFDRMNDEEAEYKLEASDARKRY